MYAVICIIMLGLICRARVVKTLVGGGADFHADVSKGRMVIIYRVMAYDKMFQGRMVLFSGGMASPLNSSTGYMIKKIKYDTIKNVIKITAYRPMGKRSCWLSVSKVNA